jgi:ectoine hydroxylase-related dioxygenase (phytanoyl-CoA dioxygenase family)
MATAADIVSSYGVSEQRTVTDDLDRAAEEVAFLGYSVVDSGYSANEIAEFGRLFNRVHERYRAVHGEDMLRGLDEHNGIRLPLAFDARFIDLAANERILELMQKLIRNKFILNQQNGIINPPRERFNQGLWHRDLPYQHFVSSRPLAVNALYCVDDFTALNGATFVLPASHWREEFPSEVFIRNHARQITAPAGCFIVLNCMLFHRGGANTTSDRRRAVNHVYSTAFIKQQIDIPGQLGNAHALSPTVADLLGFRYQIPRTVADYLRSRQR